MAPSRQGELVRQIDAAVDRMRAHTRDEPYVLSIPQDEPRFHHHSRQSADLWLHCTPFSHDDHPNQQYQTFFYHEPLSDVFQLGRNADYVQAHAHAHVKEKAHAQSSAQSTPGGMAPKKKKITLAAYTNKVHQPDKSDTNQRLPPNPRDSANLPRMLSPLHLPKPSPEQPPLLPPRPISPTLPPNIVASLDAHPYQPLEKRSRHKHSSKRLPSPAPAPDKPPHSSTVKEEPVKEARIKQEPEAETRDTPQEADEQERPSLIVSLKIPKALRKNVSRYLHMKPQPMKAMHAPPPETSPNTINVKRPRPSDEDPLPELKRKRQQDRREPSTPAPPTPASTQKEPHSVRSGSNKDLRTSVAMKRVESTDSMTNGTPPVPSRHQVNGSSTKPSPSSKSHKTAEAQTWEAEQLRLGKLGRELKHTASAYAKEDSESAALASLESFLCFILSFYCCERSMAARDPPLPPDATRTWLTLPAFWKFVKALCHSHPHLYGLACHLGVICNAMIMLRLTSKRQSDLSPEETRSLHLAVTGSLDGAKEGAAKLSLSALVINFPKTWARALETDVTAAAEEDARPGKYAGGFALPIGLETEPLTTVRAGLALLQEWCVNRSSSYKFRLCLK